MLTILRCLGVVMLLATASAARAQSIDEAKLRSVITSQLDAMSRGDETAAFAIASPEIQTLFQDAPTFMRTVRQGYPQVFRSRSHRFVKLETIAGKLIQRVFVDSDSGTVVARYEMVEIDGVWRINGCSFETAEGA